MPVETVPQLTTGVDDLRYWRRKLTDPTFVYVIQGDPGTPIKVGFAKDPLKRMATLQTAYPWELRVLYVFPGPRALERQLHRRLREGRLCGEWFDGPTAEKWLPFLTDLAASMRRAGAPGGSAPAWLVHYTELCKRHHVRFTGP